MHLDLVKGVAGQHHVAHRVGLGEIRQHVVQGLAGDIVLQRFLHHRFRDRVQHQRRDAGEHPVPVQLTGRHRHLAVAPFVDIA